MESFSANQCANRPVPSRSEWSRLRPMIAEFHHGRRWTETEIRDHLVAIGYSATTTRMVKAHIDQWNLQSSHQLRDMAAALRLLDPDPARWPSPQPSFLIRGHPYTMDEVVRFFRQRGIQNPVQWAHSTTLSEEPRVLLMADDADTASEATSGPEPTTTIPSSSSASQPHTSQSPHPPMQILTTEQKAVANLHGYCSRYIATGHAADHREPQVHQFTVHGRFGDRMQEGLAQMVRKGPGAFPNFRRGFELVEDLLADCHPMSLALYLAVVCELAAHEAYPILKSLLRHIARMASSKRVTGSATDFLRALQSSQNVMETAIISLRAALGAFPAQHPLPWQRLYIQERLCDCLYHGNARAEGSTQRAQLFRDQEAFYGPFARNVLWTLTNVADDQLDAGNAEGGKAYYTMALTRANCLSGFARAKIRYAALEGLARAEQMRFDRMLSGPGGVPQDLVGPHLQTVFRYFDEALTEAMIWFEPSGRRVCRAREQRTNVVNLLASIGYQVPPEKEQSEVAE